MPRTAERARATAAIAAFARVGSRRRRRRTKRLPRQSAPKLIERDYARELLSVISTALEHELEPLLHALPGLFASAERERVDAGEAARLHVLLEQIGERLRARRSLQTGQLEAIARKFATQTSTFQRIQLLRQTRAALGVDVFAAETGLSAIVDGFAVENVALIKSIPARAISEIERLTTRGLASATPHGEIAKQIMGRLSIGRDRARLIARDQIGKLYGQVNHARQRALGVRRFIWRTSNDERVRDEHEVREGETYSYDDPPDGELPGQPVLCRCYAEPVFDEIEGALE